jgi:SMODS-associated and fused to various effectors sensor domain
MSVSYIPEWVKLCLWGKAGGRCQYEGCNHPLYRDSTTQTEFNTAYIAHIVADKDTGPRGDPVLSPRLASDLSNLMLLCDAHHRLVDKIDVAGHPVARLQAMKRLHEERIELVTSIGADRGSHVLLYGAKIGAHDSHLSFKKAADAMVPDRLPAEHRAFEIELGRSAFNDAEPSYWTIEAEQLRRDFSATVVPRLKAKEVSHLSIFAFAPIPLLIQLGRLLSDIPAADVYQLHREPADWKWRGEPTTYAYTVAAPAGPARKTVALVLALSADVVPSRITAVLGDEVDVWVVTHVAPGNDYLQSAVQLREFRRTLRDVFNRIKAVHGEDATLHLFPAVPVAAAVEVGRVWMPKADLPFWVYDQNRATGGFTKALKITNSLDAH